MEDAPPRRAKCPRPGCCAAVQSPATQVPAERSRPRAEICSPERVCGTQDILLTGFVTGQQWEYKVAIADNGSSTSATERQIVGLRLTNGEWRMTSADKEYYRRRAAKERELAEAAEQIAIAKIHLELALLYDALVEDAEPRRKLSISWGNMSQAP